MRYAIGVPNIGRFADPGALVALAGDAEAAGWDGFFVWDHMTHRRPWQSIVDPWIVLGAVATTTQRLRIGAMVTPLPRRRPWKVARETATLDVLSGGRLVVGVGLGAPSEEFRAFGEDDDARVRGEKLDESLEIITGLWNGQPFTFHGRHYSITDVQFTPVPIQRPRVPIWVAGRWPNRRPFRRAARWDGVFPTLAGAPPRATMPPEQLAEVIAYARRHRAGDDPIDAAIEGESPPGRAGANVVEPYGEVGLTWWIEALSRVQGSLQDVRARVRDGPPAT